MNTLGYTYWHDGDEVLGYLDEYPDYWTQGAAESELKENLLSLYKDFSSGMMPEIRRHAELEIA